MTDIYKYVSPAIYLRQHENYSLFVKHNGFLWCLHWIERGEWKLLEHFLEGFLSNNSTEAEKKLYQFLKALLDIYVSENPQLKELYLQIYNENPQDYQALCLLQACILKELSKIFPQNPLQPAHLENVEITSNAGQKVFSLLKDSLARSSADALGVYEEKLNLFEAAENFIHKSLIDQIQHLYPLKINEFFEHLAFKKVIGMEVHGQTFTLNLLSGNYGNSYYLQNRNQNLAWNRSILHWAQHIPENQQALHSISKLKTFFTVESTHQIVPSIAEGSTVEDWLETLNYDKSVVAAYILAPEDICLYAGPKKSEGFKNWAIHFASNFSQCSHDNSPSASYTLTGQTNFFETFFVHIQVIEHCKLVVICEATGILFIINQLRLVADKVNHYLKHYSVKGSPSLFQELWSQESNILGYAEISSRGVIKVCQSKEPLLETTLKELSVWLGSRFRGLNELSPEDPLQDIFIHFEKGVVGISPIRDNYFILVGNEYISTDWLRFKMSLLLKLL